MLSLKDCADFLDLTGDALKAIEQVAGINTLEACTLVQDAEHSRKHSERMRHYLRAYLAQLDQEESLQRSNEAHKTIGHFMSNHGVA